MVRQHFNVYDILIIQVFYEIISLDFTFSGEGLIFLVQVWLSESVCEIEDWWILHITYRLVEDSFKSLFSVIGELDIVFVMSLDGFRFAI